MTSIFGESEQLDFGEDKSYELHTKTMQSSSEISAQKSSSHTNISLKHISLEDSLKRLISTMKSTFLPREDDTTLFRQVAFSMNEKDPLFLLRKDMTTVLVGSGFSNISNVGKQYTTFPDIRLLVSEKSRIQGWILGEEDIDFKNIILLLKILDFPPIFSTRNIIAKFRNSVENSEILEKIRFFEIFPNSLCVRDIGGIKFIIAKSGNNKILAFGDENSYIGYEHLTFDEYNPTNECQQVIVYEDDNWKINDEKFFPGEILSLGENIFKKHPLKLTFDTFYIDENSVGTVSGFVFQDRKILAESGVLMFTIEENRVIRTISGHIFIDSRGFVSSHETLRVHKEILKAVRIIYEQTVAKNPAIERGKLVQILKTELGKYCYVLTKKIPLIMPIILDK